MFLIRKLALILKYFFFFVLCLVRHCSCASSVIIAFLIPTIWQMHNKGARHIAAESRLREKELSKKHEINKRMALSSDANSGNAHSSSKPTNMKEKPLIEQTRRAILESQSSRFHDFNAKKVSHDLKWTTNTSSSDPHVAPSDVPVEKYTGNTRSIQCNSSKVESFAGNQIQGKLPSDWQTEARKRQEQELQFTASGWKRDGHGRWYRDENVSYIIFALSCEPIAIRQYHEYWFCCSNSLYFCGRILS